MPRIARRSWAAIAVLFVAGSAAKTSLARGQNPTKGPLPITLAASPSKAAAWDSVRLYGIAGLVGSASKVTIIVRRSGATVGTLSATPRADGSYQVRFGATSTIGSYQVVATAPDNKATATTSFAVVSAGVVPDDIARKEDSLVVLASRVVDQVQKAVDAQPASPAKKEVDEKLDNVDKEMAKLPAQIDILQKAMKQVFEARAKIAKPIPEWTEYQDSLERWEADADRALAKLEKLANRYSAATQSCADLDQYSEMLKVTGEALAITKTPIDKSFDFWLEKIPEGLLERSGHAEDLTTAERFGLTTTMKLAGAMLKGPKGIVEVIPTLLIDTSKAFLEDYFGKYCTKWEGPLRGEFLGESFTKQGEAFFDYTIVLDGKLMFFYPKSIPAGEPVGLLGYLEGNGSFKIRDNPKPVIRATPGTVLYHRVSVPPGSPYLDEIGQASRSMFLPHSFRIPVKGVMVGDSIVLTILPVDQDFSAAIVGVSTWVIMPMAGLVPQVINATIPIQKAHPIIDRVVRRRPILRITTEKEKMTAEGSFYRDTTSADKTVRVRTKLTIKACNPKCLELPLSPGHSKEK